MKRKIILVLFAAVMALGSSLYAADSKSKSTEENPQRLYTAEDYEGADLELFNMLKETSWRPKLKGFFEHTNPFSAGSKKSEKMAFKSNGEIWYTYGAAGHGSAAAFYIKDGIIMIENHRFVYDSEKDQLEDVIAGRIYNRIGEKPAAEADAADTTSKEK